VSQSQPLSNTPWWGGGWGRAQTGPQHFIHCVLWNLSVYSKLTETYQLLLDIDMDMKTTNY
jgi:hypothetical protein